MALAHKLLDAEDAVAMAMRLVLDGTPVPEAAIEAYRVGLTPDATATFAIRGIAAALHDRVAAHNGELQAEANGEDGVGGGGAVGDRLGSAPRGRNQPVGVHYAKAYWERALSSLYWTPEGPRPLLAFTLADVRSLLSRAENQIAGWRKRKEAMRLAERLMVQRKVDFLRDLAADDKAAIAEALR